MRKPGIQEVMKVKFKIYSRFSHGFLASLELWFRLIRRMIDYPSLFSVNHLTIHLVNSLSAKVSLSLDEGRGWVRVGGICQ